MMRQLLCPAVVLLLVAGVGLAEESKDKNTKRHVCAEGMVTAVEHDMVTVTDKAGTEHVLDCRGAKISAGHKAKSNTNENNKNNNNGNKNEGNKNNTNSNTIKNDNNTGDSNKSATNNNANNNNSNKNNAGNAPKNTNQKMTLADLKGKMVTVYGEDQDGKCVVKAIVVKAMDNTKENNNTNNKEPAPKSNENK